MIVQIGLLSSVASMPSLCMKKHLGALQPAILGALPDMSKEQSLELLELYIAGWALQLLSLPPSHAHGTAISLVNFFMTLWISHDMTELLSDYQSFAAVVALLGLLSVTMEAILIIKYWAILPVLAIFFSICFYMVITWGSQSFWLFAISPRTLLSFLQTDMCCSTPPSCWWSWWMCH